MPEIFSSTWLLSFIPISSGLKVADVILRLALDFRRVFKGRLSPTCLGRNDTVVTWMLTQFIGGSMRKQVSLS